MANGLRVMYLRDAELPLVRGSLLIRGGTLWEEPERWGAVSALGAQLRQGGAGTRSAEELDRVLEELSAGISTAAGGESINASFRCLSSDLETVLSLFADVVLRPRFEEGRLDLWKGQNLEAIRRRVDEPSAVAGLALGELLYGWSPYGRFLLEDDVRGIARTDLSGLHRSTIVPDGAILTVTGDVDRAKLELLLERNFGGWRASGRSTPHPPLVEAEPIPGIYFIRLPYMQSTIYLGQLGVPRLTEDYIAIEGFNELFGASGFGSMLMQRIRTELGLAYSVYGGILPGPVRGKNVIALQTKAESTGTAIVESLRVLGTMQRSEVEGEKLAEAKRSITNSFIFRFDTVDDALNRRALQTYLNYPADYDSTYLPQIAALTPGEIRAAAERRWDLSKFVIVVVGDDKAYASVKESLSSAVSELQGYELREVAFEGRLRAVGGL
jgi:zinc protease